MALNTSKTEFDDELKELIAMPNVDTAITQAGTTYSEISALANIPVKTIGFDPGIINDYRNARTVTLMKRSIKLAGADGISLVFSGIDTVEQTRLLNDIGARYAQGNMYASAMTAQEICGCGWKPWGLRWARRSRCLQAPRRDPHHKAKPAPMRCPSRSSICDTVCSPCVR